MSEPTTPPSGDQQPYGQQPQQQPYPQQPYQQPYPQGGGQPGYGDQYGYAGYPPVQARPNNTMAIIALVAGICGLTALPFLGSIAAVILGPMAKKEIARTGEGGEGFATWGTILGWIGIGLGVLAVLFFVVLWGTLFATVGATTR